LKNDDDTCSSIHTVTYVSKSTSPSVAALRIWLEHANLTQATAKELLQTLEMPVANELEHLLAEKEALRQQVEELKGAPANDFIVECIKTKLNELRWLPQSYSMLQQQQRAGKNRSKRFRSELTSTKLRVLFDVFDFRGSGALGYDEVLSLSHCLGHSPMTEEAFQQLCFSSGSEVAEVTFEMFQQMHQMSGRDAGSDLQQALAFGADWRVGWQQLVDEVLAKVDGKAGGRSAPFKGLLLQVCPGQELLLPDLEPLFPHISASMLLQEVQNLLERTTNLFYEWGCWLRQHHKLFQMESCSGSAWFDGWNLSCYHCGAAPEAISSELECHGCGKMRTHACPIEAKRISPAKAEEIATLQREYMEILAALGVGFRHSIESDSLYHSMEISLHDLLKSPPKLPREMRPCSFTPRSLLHRLAVRAEEVSAAAAKLGRKEGECKSLSREEWEAGELSRWKLERGIADNTHAWVGPHDAERRYIPEDVEDLSAVAWPVRVFFYECAALALPPSHVCKDCGRVFYSQADLSGHFHVGGGHAFVSK